jgi:hypothetical protein
MYVLDLLLSISAPSSTDPARCCFYREVFRAEEAARKAERERERLAKKAAKEGR